MKYLILSEKGDYLPIAIRLQEEGNDVSLYIKDVTRRNIGNNLVPLVDSYRKLTPDITILDLDNPKIIARRLSSKIFSFCDFVDLFTKDKAYFLDICEILNVNANPDVRPDSAVEGWFNGSRFVLPTFHHKYKTKIFPGDIGNEVQNGYMGVESTASWEIDKRLETFADTLKEQDYKGILRLEYNGTHLCRPSDRFIVPTMFELLDVPLGRIISDCVEGKLGYVKAHREKAVATRISIPPFPYCPKFFWGWGYYNLSGSTLWEYNAQQMKHLWPLNIFLAKIEGEKICAAGHAGDLGYVTARSGLMSKEGKRRIMRTIGNMNVPNLQYRIDV